MKTPGAQPDWQCWLPTTPMEAGRDLAPISQPSVAPKGMLWLA